MKAYKWFWLTFGGWCFVTSVGAWALIFSPFHMGSKKISEFKVKVNGVEEIQQISACDAPLDKALEAITRQWQSEGWKCSTGPLNLASLLLDLPKKEQTAFDQVVQLRLFEKNHMVRLLGLLSDFEDGQTYEWTAEVPQDALQNQNPSKVDFPFKPSARASNVFTAQSADAMVCGWSLPDSDNLEAQFQKAWLAQGFSGRLWSKQDGKFFYLLRRGDTRLLAVLQSAVGKNIISLVQLDKI